MKYRLCIEVFNLVYWKSENSVNIHPSAELISPEEDPTVYSVRDNFLVKFKKENYKGGIASYDIEQHS